MKIRFGFVSNSSSSSFVVIAKKETFDRLYAEADSYTKQTLDWLRPEPRKFCNIDIVVITGMSGNYSSFEDFKFELADGDTENTLDENDIDPEGLFYDFKKQIKTADQNDIISLSIDC